MATTPDYWAMLSKLNIHSAYKVNRGWWHLESHGSHTVNGVQLVPGAPGFDPKAAYLLWTTLLGVPAASAATPLTLTGTNGNDTLTGATENDSFTGGAGADSLSGGAGDDTFNVTDTASDGSDTIDGGAGTADVIAVAAGQTLVFAPNDANITGVENIILGAAASVTLTGQTEGFSITGSTGNETVVGSDGNDTITAGAGADSITGGGGADSITGGSGADVIDVGNNDAAVDTVVLAATADSFVGAITSGTTNLSASIDVVSNLAIGDQIDLTALGLNASIAGAAVTSNLDAVTTAGSWGLIRGTYVGGVFTQNTGTDTHTLLVYDADGAGFNTSLGAVVLVGLFGGSAFNGMVTLAAPPTNNITGTAGSDTLTGTAGNDTFEGLAGADSLSGGDGNDVFNVTNTGNDGSDTIEGGAGNGDVIAVATGQTLVLTNNDASITGVENITLGADASVTLTGQLEGFNITGGGGNETVVCGAGDDTIAGGAGNDDINAGGGINLVTDAGQGNDTIRRSITGGSTTISVTGTGTVTLIATTAGAIANSAAGVNTVVNASTSSGQGAVTLNGNTGNDSLTGGALADTITGGAGNDTITGGAGVDSLNGGDGNDTFNVTTTASDGSDTIDGGNDSDTIAVAGIINLTTDIRVNNVENVTLGAGFRVSLANQTEGFNITASTGNESVTGGNGNDTITGLGGSDTLDGGSGNDSIDAGDGNDSIRGGAGNDTLVGGAGDDLFSVMEVSTGDRFDGGDGNDTINVIFNNALPSADDAITNIENITFGSAVSVSIAGQTEGFRITGDVNNNIVVLGSGAQLRAQISIVGGGGTDRLEFSNGTNLLTLDDMDFVNVTGFRNLTSTGSGLVTASLGANFSAAFPTGTTFTLTNSTVPTVNLQGALATVPITLTAGSNNDTLIGGTVNDSLLGSGGDDTLIGNGGNDTLGGGTGNDSISAGDGNDSVTGDDGDDTLIGGEGNDTLDGGIGNDSIDAGAGNDTLTSADGDDTLVGGEGSDSMVGGNNADRIVLTELSSQIDIVSLQASVATSTHSGTVVLATANNDDLGADTIVDFDFTSTNADVFVLTISGMSSFAHGTNTTVGTATGSATASAAAYASNVGLIDVNANGIFSDPGDIAMTFSGNVPTEAQLESRIRYVMTGTSSNDNLTGGDLVDSIEGGSGNDTLIGGSGNDTLFGGGGADSLIGGDGDDVFFYASSSENSVDDIVVGGNGTDTIVVAAGVSFSPNTSFTNPPTGVEKILLGVGASTNLNGLNQGYEIICNTGNEIGTGGHGNDTISGGDGNDNLFGGLGIDIISGDGGNDTLNGWDGNDTLSGGAGTDSLTGGAGSDVFVYTTASDSNAVTFTIDIITGLALNGSSGDLLDFSLTGTLTVRTATVAAAQNAADTISEITGLFNSTNGSEDASEEFTGGGNATAILATMTNGTLLVVDVDGDGAFTASDVVINVTGVTVTSFTTACFI